MATTIRRRSQDLESIFKFRNFVLKFSGFTSNEPSAILALSNYLFYMVNVCLFLTLFPPMFLQPDFNSALNVLLPGLITSVIVARYIMIRASAKNFISLLNDLETTFFKFVSYEDPIFQDFANLYVRLQSILLYFTIIGMLAPTFASMVFNYITGIEKIPYNFWTPFPNNFYKALIFNFVEVNIIGIDFFIGHILQFNVFIIISTLLETLRDNILKLKQNPDKHLIRKYILLQVDITRSILNTNRILGPIFVYEMALSSIQCCMAAYYCFTSLGADEADKLVVSMVSFLSPLVVYYVGSHINELGDQVFKAIYEIEWYTIEPVRERKMIYSMLQGATRPLTLNYKRIIFFTLAGYAGMLQGAYSYTALLRTLDTNN